MNILKLLQNEIAPTGAESRTAMKTSIFGLMLALVLSGCGGGSSATPAAPQTVAQATPTPGAIVQPTSVPVTAPTTKPATQRAVGALGGGTATSALARRALGTSVVNGIPKIISSYTANANWGAIAGTLYVWEYDTQSGQTVPATTAALTAPNVSLSGPLNLDTGAHFGLTNDWQTLINGANGVGLYSMTVAFNDGTTGTIPLYSYDTLLAGCNAGTPQAFAYTSGAPKPSTTAASDMYADCAGNLVFPHGATLASAPNPDATGNLLTTITGVTTIGAAPSGPTTLALSSLVVGQVYVFATGDGGRAKVQVSSVDTVVQKVNGQGLYTNATTFSF